MLFCQDKEIGVGAMERKRIEYIDWLRIINVKDSGLERSFIRELVNLKEYRL